MNINIGRPQEAKIHRKKKTARAYTNVDDVIEFLSVLEGHGDRIAYTYFGEGRKLCDVTYAELTSKIKAFGAGLHAKGLDGARIAILGETSVEWVSAYLAILATGGVAIPMDKELDITEIEGLLASVDAKAIVYSKTFEEKLANAKESHPSLTNFISMTYEKNSRPTKKNTSFADILAAGEKKLAEGYEFPAVADREALAELLFTSGTTGSSKRVMLSQKNIFSVVSSACATVEFTPDDTIVSVLPIHHTYELACMMGGLDYGMHICINDSLTHVLKNFQIFKPTGLVLVPLFVYTIYKKIWAEAKKSGRDKKLKLGIGASRALKTVGIDKRRDIFAEVLNSFGGRLEKIVCGGAALNPKMIEFFENIGVSIYEGFGITECAPLTCVSPYFARKYGSVGPAVPCCTVRISGNDKNDFGYTEGEIQVSGDNVMLGYYNDEEATRAAFTEDGWFRTGDMGYMDSDGYVYITGRLKSVIVLENGKNVFPEEIEEYLGDIEEIAEAVVVGRGKATESITLTAVIFPDATKFSEGTSKEDMQKAIEEKISELNAKLPIYKHIKAVELRDTEFEKTTSKKIRRHLVK